MTGAFNHASGRLGDFDVWMLTTVHRANDNRIFDKEAVSLARAGYRVAIIGPHPLHETRDGVAFFSLDGDRTFVARLLRVCTLLRMLCKYRPRVAHVHDPELFLLAFFARFIGVRIILDVHEDYGWIATARARLWGIRTVSRWLVWALQWLLGFIATRVVTVDDVIRSRFPGCRCCVIGNFPPLSMTLGAVREKTEPLKIAYPGLLNRERCVGELIGALQYLEPGTVEIHLIGDLGTDIDPTILDSESVVAHGRVPWDRIGEILGSCHIGAVLFRRSPELLNVSGYGNTKLFEFMAAGLPVVMPNFPRLRSLAEELGTACTVDPEDPRSIADCFRHLASNPLLMSEMGARGRKLIATKFNWEREGGRLVELYRSLDHDAIIGRD